MDKHEGKNRYEQTLKIVKSIVLEEDWAGLISAGAPLDEYDGEIELIVALLSKKPTVAELAIGIERIFVDRIGGETGYAHLFEKAAAEILRRSKI